MDDMISRQAAIDALYDWSDHSITDAEAWHLRQVAGDIKSMPPVQPKQRYTEEELRVFRHGISLSLLSKRSSQHWSYDEDTAKEIFNDGEMDLVHIHRWVKKTLGIELKEVFGDEE